MDLRANEVSRETVVRGASTLLDGKLLHASTVEVRSDGATSMTQRSPSA